MIIDKNPLKKLRNADDKKLLALDESIANAGEASFCYFSRYFTNCLYVDVYVCGINRR